MKTVVTVIALLAFVAIVPFAYGFGLPPQTSGEQLSGQGQRIGSDSREATPQQALRTMNMYGYSGPYTFVHYRNLSDGELKDIKDLVRREGTEAQKQMFANEWQRRGLSVQTGK
jgi:hypothetical protein